LGETLETLGRQTYPNLRVLISDDASTDGSAEICWTFAQDPRFTVVVQPERLGWVENANWLLRNATGDFVSITAHDDLLDPRYFESLVAALEVEPDAVMAYCDVHEFGELDQVLFRPDLRGGAVDRVVGFMASHYDGVAYRGLVRREVVAAARGLTRNAMDDFAADLVWLARLAGAGELRRVPQVLYSKRRHHESASLQWGPWSEQRKQDAWTLHCGEMLDVALGLELTTEERKRVVDASVRRLLQVEPDLPFPFIRDLPRDCKLAMVASLLDVANGHRGVQDAQRFDAEAFL
jgi:GT2 family glycosyltransferase